MTLRTLNALVALAALNAGNAAASVTYTYTSAPLTIIVGDAAMSEPFTINLTFSDDGTDLLGWEASQSVLGILTSADPVPADSAYWPTIFLFTSSTGEPTLWQFGAHTQYPNSIYWEKKISSFNQLDAGGGSLPGYNIDQAFWDSPPPDVHLFVGGYSYAIGTWTSTGVLPNLSFSYVHNPNPIPIPAAAWLLGSALGVLGWMRRKVRPNPCSGRL